MSYRLEDLPRRIASRITVNPQTGCWVYDGVKGVKGYMKLQHLLAGERRVHRVVYRLLVGPIPPGFTLDHVRDRGCVSRACCWPVHLEPVTNRENVRRGHLAPQDSCVHGHPRNEVNTYVSPSGKRQCRVCGRIQGRKRARRVTRRVTTGPVFGESSQVRGVSEGGLEHAFEGYFPFPGNHEVSIAGKIPRTPGTRVLRRAGSMAITFCSVRGSWTAKYPPNSGRLRYSERPSTWRYRTD